MNDCKCGWVQGHATGCPAHPLQIEIAALNVRCDTLRWCFMNTIQAIDEGADLALVDSMLKVSLENDDKED